MAHIIEGQHVVSEKELIDKLGLGDSLKQFLNGFTGWKWYSAYIAGWVYGSEKPYTYEGPLYKVTPGKLKKVGHQAGTAKKPMLIDEGGNVAYK